jgi:hypothetical protein
MKKSLMVVGGLAFLAGALANLLVIAETRSVLAEGAAILGYLVCVFAGAGLFTAAAGWESP